MKTEAAYISTAIVYFQLAQKQLIALGIIFGIIIFLNTTTISAPISFIGIFLIIFFYVSYKKQIDNLKFGGVVIDA